MFVQWLVLGICFVRATETQITPRMKNVVLIIIDDLRPELGCYQTKSAESQYYENIYTPNINYIASHSLVAKEAFVQQALCSPSRASFLTGRRPDTTHVYTIAESFRQLGGNFTTLPEYFKQHGYKTAGMGKVFHTAPEDENDQQSWTEPFFNAPYQKYWSSKMKSWRAVSPEEHAEYPLPDEDIAEHACHMITSLGTEYQQGGSPFFMVVGFKKPHLPFIFPEKHLEHYPLEEIYLPSNPYVPSNFPYVAWSTWGELRLFEDIKNLGVTGRMNQTLPDDVVLNLRRAYYASVSFVDEQVGRITSSLFSNDLVNDTIVVVIGDHGYQLGEHSSWVKHTNFELSTHAPFMISIPGLTDERINTRKLIEFVDLFPTLVEAAGLPHLELCPEDSSQVAACTEGLSLIPLITSGNNGSIPWKSSVFSQHPRNRHGDPLYIMGYSVRTRKFRYTEWVRFNRETYIPDWKEVFGKELYDLELDPDENVNCVRDSAYADDKKKMKWLLRGGWRSALKNMQDE